MSRRRELAVVIALVVAGLGLRYAMTAHWCFAGSDSYGYMKLSDELRHHGRLSLGADQPLQWARLPLYPIFLMIKGEAHTDMDWHGDAEKGAGWLRISHAQAWLDMLLMALGVWWTVRRLVGPRAALYTLGFASFSPFTTPYVGAVLTETLAIALSTVALLPLLLWSDRPRRAFAASGALVGLGMLLRADAILLVSAFVPALYFLCASWSERLKCGLIAAVLCLTVFAPWPMRNQIQFGAPHAIGARIDRESQPLENVDGYWRWLRTFGRTWNATTSVWTCYYESSSACESILPELDHQEAFDSPLERARVQSLLFLRAKHGLTVGLDAAFAKLADERTHAHPLLVYVIYPLLRAGNMWVTWYSETMPNPAWRPLRPVSNWIFFLIFPLTMAQFLVLIASGAFLLTRPRLRAPAAILLTMMLTRTLVLGYTAYCMPRYATEMMPLGWVLIAAAACESLKLWRERQRERS